jgi:hypothetical protein
MPVTINGTTGIAGIDGSAGTPAVQGTDTNTGVFFPAADTVAISAGGTEDFRIGPLGQIGLQGANYGSSGQVLRSNGSAAAASWGTISSSGALIRAPQILTAGTSYTTPSNCTSIYVEAWGGGGNGGSAASSTTYDSCSGGGGAGAYCAKYFTVTGSTAYTYAIGAGGSGNTTFTVGATTITAGGGSTGTASTASTSGAGGAGGTATNGDFNARGASGGTGYTVFTGASAKVAELGGFGASSAIGGGGIPPVNNGGGSANGGNAVGYASGGSGAIAANNNTQSGGSGTQGVIRIWEFT